MKVKYSLLLVFVIILLFSIGSVVAGDNNTLDSDDTESVDLSVTVESDKVVVDVNEDITWTIVANSDGGISKNTKVQTESTNLKYIHHSASKGSYNPKDGIWNIGDLKNKATLKIKTKSLRQGEAILQAKATTDSNDIDLDNNVDYGLISVIKDYTSEYYSATSKRPALVSATTSVGENGNNHNVHYNPNEYSQYRTITKSNDEQSFYAKTNKTLSNKTVDNKSLANQSSQISEPGFDFTPIIILAILFLIVVFAIYKRYSS